MLRAAILLLASAALCPAWVESVEFAWNACPRPLWERDLVWIKNIGIAHVSLPPAKDSAELTELVGILRRLNLEADLEGPVPASLLAQTKAHGGPITAPLTDAARISALAPDALTRSRKLILAGRKAIVWTDVEDTLGATGFRPGAVNFAGDESAAAGAVHRSARLARFWSALLPAMVATPIAGGTAQEFAGADGASFVSVVNAAAQPWTGDVKALYPPLKRIMVLPNVTVPARDSLWLPVNLPLTGAFAATDHLVYATAELTSMEYENGILAMEFSAPTPAEAILQLSRQPSGPLVAGGKLTDFDWDDKTQRVRLTIPQGTGSGSRVRIGLAIEAPDATAFFETAKVLLIGETNSLTAEFSSALIAQRSRLRTAPEMPSTGHPAKEELKSVFQIVVPPTAIPGDHADLAIEADGVQMSHARPEFLPPAVIGFPDATTVRLGPHSSLPLFPPAIPVNQRSGREVALSLQNNSSEIRNFQIQPSANGFEFSPVRMDVVVGASATREVIFRVFPGTASPGLHAGEVRLSGAAAVVEPFQLLLIPPAGSVAWSSGPFSFVESARQRASFLPSRWLEFLNKDNGQDPIASGGIPFTRGPVESLRLQDLESLLPKARK